MRSVEAKRIIALEEAFLHPLIWDLYPEPLRRKYEPIKSRLMDVGPKRIERMKEAGIDLQVLSLVEPGIQFIADPETAIEVSTEINDWLGSVVRSYPASFAGFAALPTQSPADAAAELERTVRDYGFVGALINGHTHGRYLDHESFEPLLAKAQALDVPIYIHPTDPPREIASLYYDDSPSLIAGWGWQVETGTHLLRLIFRGVFDRFPNLRIIVGHMGELLPYCFTRLNTALSMGEWLLSASEAKAGIARPRARMEKSLSYYMRNNVYVTSSGVFDASVFTCALNFLGIDNLLFSVDDPFRDNFEAMEFLGHCGLGEEEMTKFTGGNAERLLKLPRSGAATASGPARRRDSRHGTSFASLRARAKSKMGRALLSFLLR